MHLTDTKDRLKLHVEIERIVSTGQKMSQETENLTRALKGSLKRTPQLAGATQQQYSARRRRHTHCACHVNHFDGY